MPAKPPLEAPQEDGGQQTLPPTKPIIRGGSGKRRQRAKELPEAMKVASIAKWLRGEIQTEEPIVYDLGTASSTFPLQFQTLLDGVFKNPRCRGLDYHSPNHDVTNAKGGDIVGVYIGGDDDKVIPDSSANVVIANSPDSTGRRAFIAFAQRVLPEGGAYILTILEEEFAQYDPEPYLKGIMRSFEDYGFSFDVIYPKPKDYPTRTLMSSCNFLILGRLKDKTAHPDE